MKTIDSEMINMIDVDNTIIMENPTEVDFHYDDIYTGKTVGAKKHKLHIEQLIKHKERGFTNIVWSGNGYKHAEHIVKCLGLEKYVDYCMSKPVKYWDDLVDANDILKARVYLEDK